MAWNISERFPSWGETGEFPAAGFFYEGGDQVNEKHLDALWNGINGLEEDVQAALNDIDSDGDGEVDAADIARALDSSEVGDGLNGGDGTALSVDVTDLLGTGLTESSNNLVLDESVIKDGGSKEIDAAEFGGGSGTSGQVLQTDGAAASWVDIPTGVDVSEDGFIIQSAASDINFGFSVDVIDDGDGTVTVNNDGTSALAHSIIFGRN